MRPPKHRAKTEPRIAHRALVLASFVSMGLGFAWFVTPNKWESGYFSGSTIEPLNWRGFPFMSLAVLLSIFATVFTQWKLLGAPRLWASLGLLISGFVCSVAGMISYFTPKVDAYGDAVMIGYPNADGLPAIVVASVLSALAAVPLQRRYLTGSPARLGLGFLVAGLVSLGVADVSLVLSYFALLNAGVPVGPFYLAYARPTPAALWLAGALILWPANREEWRGSWLGPPADPAGG